MTTQLDQETTTNTSETNTSRTTSNNLSTISSDKIRSTTHLSTTTQDNAYIGLSTQVDTLKDELQNGNHKSLKHNYDRYFTATSRLADLKLKLDEDLQDMKDQLEKISK